MAHALERLLGALLASTWSQRGGVNACRELHPLATAQHLFPSRIHWCPVQMRRDLGMCTGYWAHLGHCACLEFQECTWSTSVLVPKKMAITGIAHSHNDICFNRQIGPVPAFHKVAELWLNSFFLFFANPVHHVIVCIHCTAISKTFAIERN